MKLSEITFTALIFVAFLLGAAWCSVGIYLIPLVTAIFLGTGWGVLLGIGIWIIGTILFFVLLLKFLL